MPTHGCTCTLSESSAKVRCPCRTGIKNQYVSFTLLYAGTLILEDAWYSLLPDTFHGCAGIKFVRQYAPRVKENRHKMGIQHVQAKRLPRYAPPIKKNVLI